MNIHPKTIQLVVLIVIGVTTLGLCQPKTEQSNYNDTEVLKQANSQTTLKASSQVSSSESDNAQPNGESSMTTTFEYRGTIRFFEQEGGFFGIVTDDGKKFLPSGLASEIAHDGAIIEFNGKIIEGMMTIQQWGTTFEVTSFKLIKAGESD